MADAPPGPAPTPAGAAFVPENVGRLFWWRPPEYPAGVPVHLFDFGREAVSVVAPNGDHVVIENARAAAELRLLPADWNVVGGKLMRPVHPEELP